MTSPAAFSRPAAAAGLVLLSLLCSSITVRAHPQCVLGPTSPQAQELEFCVDLNEGNQTYSSQYAGACCAPGIVMSDNAEFLVEARFDAAITLNTSDTCKDLHKQVVCSICHPYSEHLHDIFAEQNGVLDGLAMTSEFCSDYVAACGGKLAEGVIYDDFCDSHTVPDGDPYYSYPYTEDESPEGAAAFPGVTYPEEMVSFAFVPAATDQRFWVVSRLGEIKEVIPATEESVAQVTLVADLQGIITNVGAEDGVLSLAFSPDFPNNQLFYVSYTVDVGSEDENEVAYQMRLSKFQRVDQDPGATLLTEEVLLQTDSRREKNNGIHFGSWLGFRPWEYGQGLKFATLLWSLGDGGPQNDGHNDSQNTTSLWGSIIRIKVPNSPTKKGYKLPKKNPFFGQPLAGRPEIYAWGLRNPWRCSLDRAKKGLALYCGDVGQKSVEEVLQIRRGKNYGWGRYEGSRCHLFNERFFGSCPDAWPMDEQVYEPPYFEYCHVSYYSNIEEEGDLVVREDLCPFPDSGDSAEEDDRIRGNCVIGGVKYRGTKWEHELGRAYVFADYQTRQLIRVRQIQGVPTGEVIDTTGPRIISFAEDNDGEVYMLTKAQGQTPQEIIELGCGNMCMESLVL